MKAPFQGYLQFMTHWESRALIFLPLSESTGWRARIQGGVFIKINWATQLSTVFSKCCSICPSPGQDTLLLLFSQNPGAPRCTQVPLFSLLFTVLFSWAPAKVVIYSPCSPNTGLLPPGAAWPASLSSVLPSPFPPAFSPIKSCYQGHMGRFMHGWAPARFPLIVSKKSMLCAKNPLHGVQLFSWK